MAELSFDDFFKSYKLEDMKSIFISNEFVSVRALLEVTNEDLKELGVNAMGKRKEFLSAINEVREMKNKTGMATSQVVKEDICIPVLDTVSETATSTPVAKRKLDLTDISPLSTPKKMKVAAESVRSPSSAWFKTPSDPLKILIKKNIKLYSEKELNKAYGLRRKKMVFFNQKLLELMENSDVRCCSKTVIVGMVETAWDRFNANDAAINVAEVDTLLAKLEAMGKCYNDKQTKTIKRAVDRLNTAKKEVAASLKVIGTMRDNNRPRKDIKLEEQDLTVKHQELQKATDALRKAADIKIKELSLLLEKSEDENDISDVSDISNDSIVEGIKDTN